MVTVGLEYVVLGIHHQSSEFMLATYHTQSSKGDKHPTYDPIQRTVPLYLVTHFASASFFTYSAKAFGLEQMSVDTVEFSPSTSSTTIHIACQHVTASVGNLVAKSVVWPTHCKLGNFVMFTLETLVYTVGHTVN